ncbi:hypothetical protein QJQ45_017717 [Haematococcus lacustris]|nr:hypothetical protein QJQ45_017717 [Haematococcus lacustris]
MLAKLKQVVIGKLHGARIEDAPASYLQPAWVVHADLERALTRLHCAVLVKEQRARQLWRESKLRAKQRLAQHLNAILATGGSETTSQSVATPDRIPTNLTLSPAELAKITGDDGPLRTMLMSCIGHASRFFMQQANSTHVVGAHHMQAALSRPANQGLLTVCNHVASVDDPLVVASIVPQEYYSRPSSLRWTLCATDRCFKYAALAPLFTAAKVTDVLPVQRGSGMHQPGMQAAEMKLAAGDWVHIFPEGTRSRNPEQLGPVRRGVGRLVAAAAAQGEIPPLVLPFVHSGMQEVAPVGSVLPRTGKQVYVMVGEPIPVEDLLREARTACWTDEQLYTQITARVGLQLQRMHAELTGRRHALLGGEEESDGQIQQPDDRQVASHVFGPRRQTTVQWSSKAWHSWDHVAFAMWHRAWTNAFAATPGVAM